jgi:hypothetical protein
MWLVLFLSLLLCIALALFVLAPLATGEESISATSLKGFADEKELRQALGLRDSLLEKCVYGRTQEPLVDALDEREALEALVALCERLRTADLPYLPKSLSRTIAVAFTAIVLGSASLISAPSSVALAQALPPEASADPSASTPASSAEPRVPPPVPAEGGAVFASLHQFVLSPREGRLHAYYLGLMNNVAGATELSLALPLPVGFEDLKISNMPQAVLEASGRAWPVVRAPVKPGIVEVRAEFSLPAPLGSVRWENSGLPPLPGTLLFLMPEYQSLLRNITENVFPSFNVWPPRVVDAPAEFRNVRTQEQYDPADPNFHLLSRMPPEYTRNLVRVSDAPAPYPSFEVTGLSPTRVPLYGLGLLFGAFLAGAGVYAISRSGKAARKRSAALGATGTA